MPRTLFVFIHLASPSIRKGRGQGAQDKKVELKGRFAEFWFCTPIRFSPPSSLIQRAAWAKRFHANGRTENAPCCGKFLGGPVSCSQIFAKGNGDRTETLRRRIIHATTPKLICDFYPLVCANNVLIVLWSEYEPYREELMRLLLQATSAMTTSHGNWEEIYIEFLYQIQLSKNDTIFFKKRHLCLL